MYAATAGFMQRFLVTGETLLICIGTGLAIGVIASVVPAVQAASTAGRRRSAQGRLSFTRGQLVSRSAGQLEIRLPTGLVQIRYRGSMKIPLKYNLRSLWVRRVEPRR